jgi:RNA polymerase sigma-70 factor (ECF subfamily)
MERVVAQQPVAQAQLVRRLMARVQRATRALLCDPVEADDATQICLIELLKSAHGFRGDGSLEAWSDRIVVRTTMRYVKRRARAAERVVEGTDPDRVSAPVSAEREGPMSERLPRSVEEYLERLSTARRTALILRHVLGHSVAEIAEITGVSPNTVKDRLLSARREFRRMVRRDHSVAPKAVKTTRRSA